MGMSGAGGGVGGRRGDLVGAQGVLHNSAGEMCLQHSLQSPRMRTVGGAVCQSRSLRAL